MNEVSRLKFKLISGTWGLNEEKGRQSNKEENKWCKCCNEGEEEHKCVEDVCHFLVRCKNSESIRKQFLNDVNILGIEASRVEIFNGPISAFSFGLLSCGCISNNRIFTVANPL